jgi:predicted enzyme related to lactoylglutathione lyase
MVLRFELFPVDIDRSVDFYTSVLGFKVDADKRDSSHPYASLRRDGVVIGLSPRPSSGPQEYRRPPTGVEVVLEVDDLDAEYESVRQAGGEVTEGLRRQPWGLTDFRICDPDGYYLRITEHQAD